ncbi:ChaN family lipoprotein [Variovorax sp. J22G21]|uniref:ChaN family lipoprotein n=1 Tax=Variovorax fucosicus TaxID=3053517 RepID=UPI002574ED94|nr:MULTISPECIES: ChaN family lipoprotein [unclassified Variovorax]MDM0038752.1 ChaN family lipoprotein [Variovorax sp. J22R193]MDM0063528.1 ChaN family lipoprotein [Variovorax sp. J22G21]
MLFTSLRPLSILTVSVTLLAAGCAWLPPAADAPVAKRVAALLPADALLLGEQHDADEHHRIERETVEALLAKDQLAALALEMAEDGQSTARLPATATEAQVRAALEWQDKAWPWEDYGPAVMAAVRAGVPVIGANMPRARMKDAMVDVSLDAQLSDAARVLQQEAVRSGHCNLLPAAQIVPMTRIQIARDRAMAQTIVKARQPGKTVLLISGSAHALRTLGVPQHLPTDIKVVSVRLLASASAPAEADTEFDRTWQTAPLPEKDYCATLKRAS